MGIAYVCYRLRQFQEQTCFTVINPVGKKKEAITWPSLNFSKHMTHLELRPSECTDSVLSVSLVLPFSSLVLNESEEPLWYFLVSILDKACSAILVREDCVSDRKKTNTWWEERSGLFNKYSWTRQKYGKIWSLFSVAMWLPTVYSVLLFRQSNVIKMCYWLDNRYIHSLTVK